MRMCGQRGCVAEQRPRLEPRTRDSRQLELTHLDGGLAVEAQTGGLVAACQRQLCAPDPPNRDPTEDRLAVVDPVDLAELSLRIIEPAVGDCTQSEQRP